MCSLCSNPKSFFLTTPPMEASRIAQSLAIYEITLYIIATVRILWVIKLINVNIVMSNINYAFEG